MLDWACPSSSQQSDLNKAIIRWSNDSVADLRLHQRKQIKQIECFDHQVQPWTRSWSAQFTERAHWHQTQSQVSWFLTAIARRKIRLQSWFAFIRNLANYLPDKCFSARSKLLECIPDCCRVQTSWYCYLHSGQPQGTIDFTWQTTSLSCRINWGTKKKVVVSLLKCRAFLCFADCCIE